MARSLPPHRAGPADETPVSALTCAQLRALIEDTVVRAAGGGPRGRGSRTLTTAQVLARIGRSRWWWRQMRRREQELGLRLLPQEIEGLTGRFARDEVDRWLRRGVPGVIDGRRLRLTKVS